MTVVSAFIRYKDPDTVLQQLLLILLLLTMAAASKQPVVLELLRV